MLGQDKSACVITIMLPDEGSNLALADLQHLSSHIDNLCPEGAVLLNHGEELLFSVGLAGV